ncbi:MAG TPA: hypothetical protein VHR45_13815 [Thermoanaerobaculia bacterium]|nr:hypothetical protein [Thermoanaerobaculia bacterium]
MGLAGGALVAAPTMRLLESFLYGVKPGDPQAFTAALLLLFLAAAAACWLPVRRALRTDPAAALRQE